MWIKREFMWQDVWDLCLPRLLYIKNSCSRFPIRSCYSNVMGILALWFSNPSAVAPFLSLEILAVVTKSQLHTITVTDSWHCVAKSQLHQCQGFLQVCCACCEFIRSSSTVVKASCRCTAVLWRILAVVVNSFAEGLCTSIFVKVVVASFNLCMQTES